MCIKSYIRSPLLPLPGLAFFMMRFKCSKLSFVAAQGQFGGAWFWD